MYSRLPIFGLPSRPLQLCDPKYSEYVNREPATKRAVGNLLYTMPLDDKIPISVLVNAVAGDPVVVEEAVQVSRLEGAH